MGDLRLIEGTDGRFRVQMWRMSPNPFWLGCEWRTLGPSIYEFTTYDTEAEASAALDRIIAGPRVIRTVSTATLSDDREDGQDA